MAKPVVRNYSRHTMQALKLMGALLRTARIERKIGTASLAERAGISRDMLYRIEKGDPRCQIGVVFELAVILGVPLFARDRRDVDARLYDVESRLALLPQAVHASPVEVKDDF